MYRQGHAAPRPMDSLVPETLETPLACHTPPHGQYGATIPELTNAEENKSGKVGMPSPVQKRYGKPEDGIWIHPRWCIRSVAAPPPPVLAGGRPRSACPAPQSLALSIDSDVDTHTIRPQTRRPASSRSSELLRPSQKQTLQ